MISIKAPRIKNSATIQTFPTYAPDLVTIGPKLRIAYISYLKHAGHPFSVKAITPISQREKDLLTGLYETTYKKLKVDCRKLDWIYYLRNSDQLPYCPMCGNTGRDALDHYLAKADFPEFSFFSFNLVPTCTSCNSKRSKHANKPGATLALLHPYFDGQELNSPLSIVRIQGTTLATGEITFEIPCFDLVPNIPTSAPLFDRLENHLTKCVDSAKLRRWVKKCWMQWRRKAQKIPSLEELRTEVQEELDIEIEVGGHNNWTAAFLRGLLSNNDALLWLWKTQS